MITFKTHFAIGIIVSSLVLIGTKRTVFSILDTFELSEYGKWFAFLIGYTLCALAWPCLIADEIKIIIKKYKSKHKGL